MQEFATAAEYFPLGHMAQLELPEVDFGFVYGCCIVVVWLLYGCCMVVVWLLLGCCWVIVGLVDFYRSTQSLNQLNHPLHSPSSPQHSPRTPLSHCSNTSRECKTRSQNVCCVRIGNWNPFGRGTQIQVQSNTCRLG